MGACVGSAACIALRFPCRAATMLPHTWLLAAAPVRRPTWEVGPVHVFKQRQQPPALDHAAKAHAAHVDDTHGPAHARQAHAGRPRGPAARGVAGRQHHGEQLLVLLAG